MVSVAYCDVDDVPAIDDDAIAKEVWREVYSTLFPIDKDEENE